MQMYFMAFIRT